jgi:hypothetical protein
MRPSITNQQKPVDIDTRQLTAVEESVRDAAPSEKKGQEPEPHDDLLTTREVLAKLRIA